MSDSKNIKIIQTVASGGTAVMYKAVQTSLDRIVAVKRLHPHLTDDENFTRRFILEAKAAASLDHPNIVRVIDFGQHEGCYQMVMEYVEGESFKEILERWRPIKWDLALSVVHQILLGLEHAHSKGIVHRDIKPGNVMLTEQGKVKITDFGLAKLTQSNSNHTAANSILGTPLYMSPEQAFGESVDQRSDLFSLGTVLYELLTGRQPFASDNYMGVIQNIINLDIPRPREVISDIPVEAEAIVGKALAKDRDNRFQSARHFREAIEDFVGVVELGNIAGRQKVLLEKSTVTQILPAPTNLPKRKSSGSRKRGLVAALVITILGGATVTVMTQPQLVEQLQELAQRIPVVSSGTAQKSDMDASTPFDMSDVLGSDHEPRTGGVIPTESLITPDPPAPKPTPKETKTASAAASKPVVEKPAPEKTPEPEKPKPKPQPVERLGYLNINSDPPAEVWVDGTYRGDAPVKLKIPAGQHSVELRHPRYETYTENLRIVTNELSRRSVELKKLKGMVSLATQEGAELWVDGKFYANTPILEPIELDAGPHLLSIKKAGYFTWSSEVTVEPRRTLPLRITLSKQY